MANLSSIARPYALAAFEVARKQKALSEWSAYLTSGAELVNHPDMIALLKNREVPADKLTALFAEILAPLQNETRKNFLKLLTANHRLNLFPEIAYTFNQLHAELEKMRNVKLITAVYVDDAYKQKLAQALTKQIHQEVILDCEIDPSIIAGAILHIGDKVIDGSVRGKLSRLLEFSLR